MTDDSAAAPRRRRSPLRAAGSVVALLLAAAVGVGGVVGVAALVGPTNSDSVGADDATQAGPSLPPNTKPDPVLTNLDPNAPLPSAPGLQAALSGPMSNPVLGTLAAQVIDPASGMVLLSQGADTALQPGSTMKLYTAAAAAVVLDPGMRITTTVSQGPVPTEITIVSGGDVTLSSQPQSTFNPGAATIQQLADAVKAAGITQVTKITIDNAIFEGNPTANGWGSGDAPSTYAAPIYPFMVDGGRTVADDDHSMRYGDPDIQAAQLLANALGSPDAVIARGTVDAAAKPVASVQSAPIEQLIEQMIVNSDNVLAEAIGRLVAQKIGLPRTFEGAVSAISSVMQEAGVNMVGFEGYDASGLSQLDKTSAQSIASLLAIVSGGQQANLDVVDSALAVSGYNGTLAGRYETGASAGAAGQVRGKTGTLTGVSSLAGNVITADGRLLVYAFISNGGGGTEEVRAALDAIAGTLATCGCA